MANFLLAVAIWFIIAVVFFWVLEKVLSKRG